MTVRIKCFSDVSCTKAVSLNQTVQFSTIGKIDFKLNSVPSTKNVYYRVGLAWSGGTRASSSGIIKTI